MKVTIKYEYWTYEEDLIDPGIILSSHTEYDDEEYLENIRRNLEEIRKMGSFVVKPADANAIMNRGFLEDIANVQPISDKLRKYCERMCYETNPKIQRLGHLRSEHYRKMSYY